MLLLRRELEDVANQQVRVVALKLPERRPCRAGEDHAVPLWLEQARRHGGPGTHHGGVEHPASCPIRFQTRLGQNEARRCSAHIVCWVACRMALQARGALAREERPSQPLLHVGERLELRREIRNRPRWGGREKIY